MGRIIALSGRANSGKSTTIKMLPAILIANGYSQVPGMFANFGGDIMDVFIKGKVRVGITSSGDTYDMVNDRLQDLVAAGCDACACACRTWGGTHNAINGIPGYTPQFQPKTYAATPAAELATNTADANTLFSLI